MTSSPRCADCGSHTPYLVGIGDGRMVCEHRYACEARRMLAAGAPIEVVAAHAQKRKATSAASAATKGAIRKGG